MTYFKGKIFFLSVGPFFIKLFYTRTTIPILIPIPIPIPINPSVYF